MELRLFLEIIQRRSKLFIMVFLAVFLAIAISVLVAQTQYVSSARVYLYKSPTIAAILSKLNLEASSAMPSTGLSDAERETYPAMAMARPILNRVIDQLHLTRERKSVQLIELIPLVRPLMNLLGVHIAPRPMTYEDLSSKSLVHLYFPRPYLKVEMLDDSDFLEFTASAESIELAVAIANASARAFADHEAAMRREECVRLAEELAGDVTRAKSEYETSLAKLKAYMERTKTVDLESEGEKIVEAVYALVTARDENQASIIRAKSQIQNIESQLAVLPEFKKNSEQIQRNGQIDSAKQTLRDLSLELANTKTKFTPEHPAVIDIMNRIAETKKIIADEAQRVFGSETISANPVHQNLADKLAGSIADLASFESLDAAYGDLIAAREESVAKFAPKSTGLSLISAEVESRRELYQVLRTLQSQAEAGKAIDFSLARFIDQARIPAKLNDYKRPQLTLFAAAGIFLGVFLGLSAVLIAEYLDGSIRSRNDVEAAGLRCLAVIPKAAGPNEATAGREAFRFLRSALFAGRDHPMKTLVVSSVGHGAGGGHVARGLAEVLAAEAPALVAETSSKPGNETAEPGLAEAVFQGLPLQALVRETSSPGVWRLAPGALSEGVQSPLESEAMSRLVHEAAAQFKAVLLRAAPINASCDAETLAGLTDGLLLVVRHGETSLDALRQTVARLQAAGISPLGAVINNAPLTPPSFRASLREIKDMLHLRKRRDPSAKRA